MSSTAGAPIVRKIIPPPLHSFAAKVLIYQGTSLRTQPNRRLNLSDPNTRNNPPSVLLQPRRAAVDNLAMEDQDLNL
jgi:hypothetical protein